MCSKDVHVRLNYCQEEPQVLPSKPTTRNSPTKPGPLETIQDVREAHEEFDLELHGFRYVKAPTDFTNWDSELEIRNVLIPEMEVLLRQELRGCDEIHVVGIKSEQGPSASGCNRMVHIDHTVSSVESMLHQKYGIRPEHLLTRRVRLINIWRPVNCVVHSDPIAIADGRGLDLKRDITSSDLSTPIGIGRYHEERHWYYMSEQAEEDVLLFKTYDSNQAASSKACLRTAFNIPDPSGSNSCSKAIEIQVLVFTHPNDEQTTHVHQVKEVETLRKELGTLSNDVLHNQDVVRAVLDLRQWESLKAAEQMHHLASDRDHSRAESQSLSKQLNYLEEWIMGLYMSCSLSSEETDTVEQLRHFICSTPRLRERFSQDEQAYQSMRQSMNLFGADAELMLLRQQLYAQCRETERLAANIDAKVESKMDEGFQAAVQTAVKQERSKDEFVIQDLRQENQRLRQALAEMSALDW
ncbi:hypothetical protein D6C95_01886 [Aureobasidium pullulans]|nr:hypothetical protein D6C95_01886 [Aureobasidium pullulans]